jgi:hypothetical protein
VVRPVGAVRDVRRVRSRSGYETRSKPYRASATLDRAVQSGIGLRRRQRAAPADTGNRVERRNDRRYEATIV